MSDAEEVEKADDQEELTDVEEGAIEEIIEDEDMEEITEFIDKDNEDNINVPDNPVMMITVTPPPEVTFKSLHQLARDGEVERLKLAMSFEENVKHIDDLDDKKLSPLHYAARYSNIEILKTLIHYGANPNRAGDDEMTPLHYSARYGRVVIPRETKKRRISAVMSPRLNSPQDMPDDECGGGDTKSILSITKAAEDSLDAVVEYLINANAGADINAIATIINAKDKYGMTSLHHCAIRGNHRVLQKLLRTPGISKEPRDISDSTPLHLACTYNQILIAQILITEGDANLRALDSDLRTPLHEACQEGNKEIAHLLLQKADEMFGSEFIRKMTSDKDDDGATPLLLGVGKGGTDIVKLLLDYKANPNQCNKEYNFPVHSAARTGDLETLKLLLENNAQIDCTNIMSETPLFLAAENNNLEVIEFLMDHGADLDRYNINVITPIMAAAIEGHADVVGLLVSKGANMDLCDKDDRSLLYHAAEANKVKVVEVLLDTPAGLDLLEVFDQYDNLPIHIAASEGHLETFRSLFKHGPHLIERKNEDEMTAIHLAALNGRVDIVEEILLSKRNAIMNEDEDSNSPLHLACMGKKARTAAVLLKYGADVHARNAKKWTPLDCSASVGAYNCAKLLLEAQAPIDPLDRTKTTPLHLAAENGHAKMIKLLLSNGADIMMEDAMSRNALERAIMSNNKKCVMVILESSDWKRALRTTHPTKDSHGTIVPETPLRMMIERYPDLAEMVFHKCMKKVAKVSTSDSSLEADNLIYSPKPDLVMDYELIDDAFFIKAPSKESKSNFYTYCSVNEDDECDMFKKTYSRNAKVVMDNHPLMIMAKEEQRNLLRHPLCLALIRRKWQNYGRYLYFTGLFFYLIFLALLTSYALLTPNATHVTYNSSDFCRDPTLRSTVTEISPKTPFFIVCQVGIIVIVLFNSLMELVQFYRSGSRYLQWTNLFDWLVYVLAFLTVYDMESETSSTGTRSCWQWQMMCANVTLAWLNLLGDIRQLPYLGIYVIMFFDILKTFLRFSVVFLVFVVAFGLGFHLLLINQAPFATVSRSLLKTTVMMTGEFEFEGIFENPQFYSLTYAFFVAFLIIMSIIVANLLIGLAVDDIKAVQDKAILKRLAMQVELVLDTERLLPNFILRRLNQQREEIKSRKGKWWDVFRDVVSRNSILKDADQLDGSDFNDQMSSSIDALHESIKTLQSTMKTLSEETRENRKVLKLLADHQNVYIDDDADSVTMPI